MAQENVKRTQSKNKNGKKTTAKGKTTTKRIATKKRPTGKKSTTTRKQSTNRTNNSSNEYLVMAQRLKAEFDNYKRRTEVEMTGKFNDGKAFAIVKILPVVDSFDQALKQISDENVLNGVKMIYSTLLKILEGMGVKKIDCVGQEFDPNYHNAVMACNTEEGDGTVRVLEELQAGFTLDDKVIRHSVVKVSR